MATNKVIWTSLNGEDAVWHIQDESGNVSYCISSCGTWRPGAFDSPETAKQAFHLSDNTISNLQHQANLITLAMLVC